MTGPGQLSGSARIDPLSTGDPGLHSDEKVLVVHRRNPAALDDRRPTIVRTPHFRLRRNGHQVRIEHHLCPDQLDNDLAGRLAEELFAPGWLSGAETFERVFAGLVKSTVDDPVQAWSIFYDNTLARMRRACGRRGSLGGGAAGHSSIAGIVPVYRRVLELVPEGRVLDIGSCFGFLALMLAERSGVSVIASDIAGGTVTLLRTMARQRGLSLGTLVCDGARVPLPDQAVDTVTVIHLLEHLPAAHGEAVITEALRLARRRIVIAVPYEREPNAAYGHIRVFTAAELASLGRSTGEPFQVDEHHGGWLIIERDS